MFALTLTKQVMHLFNIHEILNKNINKRNNIKNIYINMKYV